MPNYEVKNNCCLFERLFKVKKNGVFLFGISFFVLEIFTFLHYANEESDVVIDRSTKTVQHSIKNISGNIKAMIFKLGTRNVHHQRNKMTATILLPWQHPWFQSLSVKKQISPFATLLSGIGGLPRNWHPSHIVVTLPIRLLEVDDPCVRWNLGILAVIKTGPAAKLLSWQRHNSCHFVSFVMYISDILDLVLYCFSGTIYDLSLPSFA